MVPAELHNLGDRINNELLYLYPAFVPAERFSNSATNTNAAPLQAMRVGTLGARFPIYFPAAFGGDKTPGI